MKLCLVVVGLISSNVLGQFSQFSQLSPLNPQEGFVGCGASMTWIHDKSHLTYSPRGEDKQTKLTIKELQLE